MTLFTVLLAVVLIGLTLGLAGQTWSQVMQREREDELLFRGDQYRRAIQSYYEKSPGGVNVFPTELNQLIEDKRQVNIIRHLRKLWPEPFSNAEWDLILQPPNRIIGVRSNSSLTPFRQDGFTEDYTHFKGATTYRQWEFIYTPQVAPKATNPTPTRNSVSP